MKMNTEMSFILLQLRVNVYDCQGLVTLVCLFLVCGRSLMMFRTETHTPIGRTHDELMTSPFPQIHVFIVYVEAHPYQKPVYKSLGFQTLKTLS